MGRWGDGGMGGQGRQGGQGGRGQGRQGKQGKQGKQGERNFTQCPMPHAPSPKPQAPIPNPPAPCPMPHAPCPIPFYSSSAKTKRYNSLLSGSGLLSANFTASAILSVILRSIALSSSAEAKFCSTK